MAIVEIRCPRCGSPSHLKNEKTHEYQCSHCGATFRFVDTTKKEVLRDTRRHNCPICGRPVKADEGYKCTECAQEDLCENCVDENSISHKIVCIECIKKEQEDCEKCGKYYSYSCSVCGIRACKEHCHLFDINVYRYSVILERECMEYASIECSKCGQICMLCCVEKTSAFRGVSYHCKKCGSKVKLIPIPCSEENKKFNQKLRDLEDDLVDRLNGNE